MINEKRELIFYLILFTPAQKLVQPYTGFPTAFTRAKQKIDKLLAISKWNLYLIEKMIWIVRGIIICTVLVSLGVSVKSINIIITIPHLKKYYSVKYSVILSKKCPFIYDEGSSYCNNLIIHILAWNFAEFLNKKIIDKITRKY